MQTVLVPKKRDLKFLFKSLDILNNTINTKSTPFCKNVAILLQNRARSDAMHKFRRIKMLPCKIIYMYLKMPAPKIHEKYVLNN